MVRRAWSKMARAARRLPVPLPIIVGGALMVVSGLGLGLWLGRTAHVPSQAPRSQHVDVVQPQPPPQLPPLVSEAGDDRTGPALVEPPLPQATEVAAPSPVVPPRSGSPAWSRFRVPVTPIPGRPMIAIVVDDLGLDRRRAEKVIALKAPLTLAFMSYADDLPRMTAEAHARGHELMVHFPMQPESSAFDPGPQALLVSLPPEELRRRLDWGLSRFDGFVGINNHMGSLFTADAKGMDVVMAELHNRGLMFLDSVTTGHSAGAAAAAKAKVPFAARQVFLDNDRDNSSIRAQLEKTESLARRHGFAIAIGHPHDETIAALAQWLPQVEAKGFQLVPVTASQFIPKEKTP